MNRIIIFLLIQSSLILAQIENPFDFLPYHEGDIRQYRSMFTNEIIRTEFVDSIIVDSTSKDKFVYIRNVSNGSTNFGIFRIDSNANVYNMLFFPDYINYKLSADSGDTWITGYHNGTIPVYTTVEKITQSFIFGQSSIIKHYSTVIDNSPPFWIGTDYLCEGFGIIRTEIEPSDIYVLTGAIIDSVEYGIITSVEDRTVTPRKFEVIENYPNPFNNNTVITYSVSNYNNVNITVYDVLGSVVKELINESKPLGNYNLHFNADDLSSGPYFVVLTIDSKLYTHKMLLIK